MRFLPAEFATPPLLPFWSCRVESRIHPPKKRGGRSRSPKLSPPDSGEKGEGGPLEKNKMVTYIVEILEREGGWVGRTGSLFCSYMFCSGPLTLAPPPLLPGVKKGRRRASISAPEILSFFLFSFFSFWPYSHHKRRGEGKERRASSSRLKKVMRFAKATRGKRVEEICCLMKERKWKIQ